MPLSCSSPSSYTSACPPNYSCGCTASHARAYTRTRTKSSPCRWCSLYGRRHISRGRIYTKQPPLVTPTIRISRDIDRARIERILHRRVDAIRIHRRGAIIIQLYPNLARVVSGGAEDVEHAPFRLSHEEECCPNRQVVKSVRLEGHDSGRDVDDVQDTDEGFGSCIVNRTDAQVEGSARRRRGVSVRSCCRNSEGID